MRARHPFSLLEIMIVIALVTVIGTFTTFSLIPFYHSYRFRLEVESLFNALEELQIEALILQSDMRVEFIKKNGRWVAQTYSDEPILKSQLIDLSHVESIEAPPYVTFYANGLVQPSSLIKFCHKSNARWIDLRRGHLMKLCDTPPPVFDFGKIPDQKIIKGFLG